MKYRNMSLIVLGMNAASVFFAPSAFSHSGGISGYSGNPANGARTCLDCHGGGSSPTVALTGPSQVVAGSTNTYMLKISGGQSVNGSLDVSAGGGGVLATNMSGTKVMSGEVTQSSPLGVDSSGNAVFSFNMTAPATAGIVTLYGVGMSTNGNGTSGSGIGQQSLAITVASAAPAPSPSPSMTPPAPKPSPSVTPPAPKPSPSVTPPAPKPSPSVTPPVPKPSPSVTPPAPKPSPKPSGKPGKHHRHHSINDDGDKSSSKDD